MNRFLVIIIVIITFCACQNEKYILAEIDDIIVDKNEFLDRLLQTRKKTGLPDNGQVRRGVLKEIINEKLFILEAQKNSFHSDAHGKLELERIKIQELLNIYTKKEIIEKININEHKLKEFYIRSETKLKARHLYAATKKEADSLYNELQNGASFNLIATQIFKDPYLKNRGGDLGYISYEDMELSFADTAFSLKVGEISRPVKTNYGYSIIRIDDKIVNPLTTENEYLKKRTKILPLLTKRENNKAVKRHADSLAKNLEIKIDQTIFNKFFKQIKKNKLENQTLEEYFVLLENPDFADQIFISSNIGEISAQEFKHLAQFSSKSQRDWIKNKENFQDFIKGLVVRKHILLLAKQKDFNDGVDYKNRVNWKFNSFLINRVKWVIKDILHISEDSLFNHYNNHQNEYISPPQINLREIVVLEKSEAQIIKNELNKGIQFQDLARKFSISKSAEFDGETGFVTPIQLDNLAGLLFALKPNEWRGPLIKDKSYIFLQCIEKKKSKVLPFADVKDNIEEILKKDVFDFAVKEKLSEIKSQVKITSYPGKLRKVSYN